MVEIKICGVKDEVTASVAIDSGVTYVGIVYGTSDSPRHVDGATATNLIGYLRGKVASVLVTLELTRDFIQLARTTNPDLVQFHEPISNELVSELRRGYKGRIIFGISPYMDLSSLVSLARTFSKDDILLVDGSKGKGTIIDEHLLASIVDRVNQSFGLSLKDILVAGGISPSNVRSFLKRHAPRGVDASSGLEVAPGVKDPELIKNFCLAVKKARIVHD